MLRLTTLLGLALLPACSSRDTQRRQVFGQNTLSYLQGNYDLHRRCGGLMPGWSHGTNENPDTTTIDLQTDGVALWSGIPVYDLTLWLYIDMSVSSVASSYILRIDEGTPCSRVYSIRSQINKLGPHAGLWEAMDGESPYYDSIQTDESAAQILAKQKRTIVWVDWPID